MKTKLDMTLAEFEKEYGCKFAEKDKSITIAKFLTKRGYKNLVKMNK